MNALLILFAGRLSAEALQPVVNGKNALSLALEQTRRFPGLGKTVILAGNDADFGPPALGALTMEKRDSWTMQSLLERMAELSAGFDLVYFAWADCPFLDPDLAGKIAERHLRYAAEYSYADGWPYGLGPELLSPGTACVLAKIASGSGGNGPVERDALFSVIQKDINAFDIETEISPVDLRCRRISLCADSKRNLMLLKRFAKAAGGSVPDVARVEQIIAGQPGILRTLPAFYPIQVYGGCPQVCAPCPYQAAFQAAGKDIRECRDYMEAGVFAGLLDKIVRFSGDAVIDLSLWGEFGLHPQKMEMIDAVLSRPELALVIETSGIGWKQDELEAAASLAQKAALVPGGKRPQPPLSWIVSLDAADPARYAQIRGAGFAEALDCAQKLLSLFPKDAYVQALRLAGAEDDIEQFYLSWKEAAPRGGANIIIQKYDDFCGALERKQASDISPVIRQACWHIMRDLPVLLDGTVPLCREELGLVAGQGKGRALGNVFTHTLEDIWENGTPFYGEHCANKYSGLCAGCDEFYTYNF